MERCAPFMSSRAGGGKVWKEKKRERERDVEAELELPAACGKQHKRGRGCSGSPAASGGLPPWEQTLSIPHTTTGKQRKGEREREVWGEATGIIT